MECLLPPEHLPLVSSTHRPFGHQEDPLAFTITRYRINNPGQNTRGYDTTALDGDPGTSFLHRCIWIPDSWDFQSTDGTPCVFVGTWRGTLSDSGPLPEQKNDTFNIFKNLAVGPPGSGGFVRLTLSHLSTRP